MMRFFAVAFCFAAVLCLGGPVSASAEVHVGYRSISTWNSRENVRLDVGVWYPTQSQERDYVMEDYHVFVAKNARLDRIVDERTAGPFLEEQKRIEKEGKEKGLDKEKIAELTAQVRIPYKKYPLVLISHASGSTRFSYHTLADALVKRGYIVAVPMHSGDNAHDMRSFYSAKSLYQRARQCSLALDLLLTDESLAPYIDEDKMSFLGFGSGGSVGLLLAGAELTSEKWLTYCLDEKYDNLENTELWGFDVKDRTVNALCREPIKSQMQNFALGLQKTLEISNLENLFYYNALDSKKLVLQAVHKILKFQANWSKRKNPNLASYIYEPPFLIPYLPPLPTQYTYKDERVRNFIFVSPGLTVFYDLKKVDKKNLSFAIVGLDKDFINSPAFQSRELYEELGKDSTAYYLIANADLWSTQAPCYGKNVLVEICRSVSEEQREEVLEKMLSVLQNVLPKFG